MEGVGVRFICGGCGDFFYPLYSLLPSHVLAGIDGVVVPPTFSRKRETAEKGGEGGGEGKARWEY